MSTTLDNDWRPLEDDGFIGHVGPILQRCEADQLVFAFNAQALHRNLRDAVQGGMLMTFADRAMGQTVRSVLGPGPIATVQFDMHFVEAARVGDFVVARAQIVRATAAIVFVEARLQVDERLIASAKGIWKRLRPADRRGTSGLTSR